MLKKVTFVNFDSLDGETFETDDVLEFISNKLNSWPKHARLYKSEICQENDITPTQDFHFQKIKQLPDSEYFVINYPGKGALRVIGSVIIGLLGFLFNINPKIPKIDLSGFQSPNNDLSERENTARPNGRIPDIFGKVRSTPDHLMVPYSRYENHKEIEFSYMCVGKGEYAINADDVKEGPTKLSDIIGSSAEFYNPNESPNSGNSAFLTIGDAISEDLRTVYRIKGVNGQTLRSKDEQKYDSTTSIKAQYPDKFISNAGYDFRTYFEAGDVVTVTNATFNKDLNEADLAGTYTIKTVSEDTIVFDDPASVNSDWDELDNFADDETFYGATGSNGPDIQSTGLKWVGPFFIDLPKASKALFNFVAQAGLFKKEVGSTKQEPIIVEIDIEVQETDSSATNVGLPVTHTHKIIGSAVEKGQRGLSVEISLPNAPSYYKIRCSRKTSTDKNFNGQIVDDVKWKDLFIFGNDLINNFGDVTTVYTKTTATLSALSVTKRSFNCIVQRKLPTRVGNTGSTFTDYTTATSSADHILSFICLDKYIGNRPKSQVDFDSIYNTVSDVKDYFDNDAQGEFNYTFDDANLSFEQTVSIICNAIFCSAYRFGNLLKLNFEKSTENSVLLFNHRNKLPGSEKRVVNFGNVGNYDGLQFSYIDNEGNQYNRDIISLPLGIELFNPKKITSLGVVGKRHALYHAYRIYSKMLYQNFAVQFNSTAESEILIANDRVLIADNTRGDTQDGFVKAKNNLTLTLSQKITFEVGVNYTIFLQHDDGSVENIDITAGASDYEVVLASAPSRVLSIGSEKYASSTYIIVGDNNKRELPFLLVKNAPNDSFTNKIEAINYNQRYYENDFLTLNINPNSDSVYRDDSALNYNVTKSSTCLIRTDTTRDYVHEGSDSAAIIDIEGFLTTESYTKFLWVNKPDSTNAGHLMSNGDETLEFTSAAILQAGHSSATEVSHDYSSLINGWHHIVLSYDSVNEEMKLYVDGVEVATSSNVTNRTYGDRSLAVCGQGSTVGSSSNGFIGRTDMMRIYNKVLSSSEILDIYNKTRL